MIDFIVICASFVAATFLHKKITEIPALFSHIFYGWLPLSPTFLLHYTMLFLWSVGIVKLVLHPMSKQQKLMEKLPFLRPSVFILKSMSLSFIFGLFIMAYVFVRNQSWVEKQFYHTRQLFNFEWEFEPMLSDDGDYPLPHKMTLERLHFHEISVLTMMSLYYAFSRMQMFF